MAEVISSAANPLIKRIRLLADRKHRRREGAFVVQGIQPVWQAVEAGADIEMLIVAPDLLRQPPPRRMVAEQETAGHRGWPGCPRSCSAGSPTGTARPGWPRSSGPQPVPLADLTVGRGLGVRRAARGRQPRQPRHDHPDGERGRRRRRDPDRPVRRSLRPGRGEGEHGRPVRRAGGAGRPPAPSSWTGRRRRRVDGAGRVRSGRACRAGRPTSGRRWPCCSAARASGLPAGLLAARRPSGCASR